MSNVQHSAATGEWYTPPEWIKVFKSILGGYIDLDPCSSAKANEVVGAKMFLTAENDALSGGWMSRCYVNPPGSCDKKDGFFSVCGNVTRCSCKLPLRFMQCAYKEIRESGSDTINQLLQLATLGDR